MPLTDQQYTVRIPLPYAIVRGRDTTLYAPVYLAGDLYAPTTATISVYDAGGNAVLSSVAATITDSIARYTVLAATTAALSLGDGWRVEWVLTMADDRVLLPRSDASLVRAGLWPSISDVDLIRRVPSLDYAGSTCITTSSDYQTYLDEAWVAIMRRLIRAGNRPQLILSPSALVEPHLYLTLALIFEDLSTRLDLGHTERAASYKAEYEQAWSQIQLIYATADGENADARRRPAHPTVWLCSR